MGKDIFVISDLHMGDGGPRDNFACGDHRQQLMGFLDYVEKEGGELIILGDLFEFWQMNLARILIYEKNRPVIERLGELQASYVIGNHDIDLVGFVDEPLLSPALFNHLSRPFTLTINGKTFHFMHGHEVDPYNKGENPGKGRILTIVAAMGEDLAASPMLGDQYAVEVILEKAGSWMLGWLKRRLWGLLYLFGVRSTAIKNKLSPAKDLTRAREMLGHYKRLWEESQTDDRKYDKLIVGHTHERGYIGDWYYNTGSWGDNGETYIRISPSGDVQVFDWNKGAPKPINTELALP
ncbi:MAG: UDP-2,3-diacylglucosamine diphosphatase [Phycisphaerae bacterium]|nr:UDP-2,3-diacylglucosamine diphosphatase [Phycisphaerae bacterium]